MNNYFVVKQQKYPAKRWPKDKVEAYKEHWQVIIGSSNSPKPYIEKVPFEACYGSYAKVSDIRIIEDENLKEQIRQLDEQERLIAIQRQKLLDDNFLTFRLATETDFVKVHKGKTKIEAQTELATLDHKQSRQLYDISREALNITSNILKEGK